MAFTVREAPPTLEQTVVMVVKIAEREGFTSGGLYDYLSDIAANQNEYGTDLEREQIEERIFDGFPLRTKDVSYCLVRMATHYHLQEMRLMIRQWEAEAKGKNLPVSAIVQQVEQDLNWMRKVKLDVPDNGGSGKRISLFGHPITGVVRWMGKQGWEFEEAKRALERLNMECADSTIRAQLRAGEKGERGEPASITSDQKRELERAAGI